MWRIFLRSEVWIFPTRAYGAGSSSLVRRLPENLRHTRPIPNGYWHLDEMVIVIRGQRYWLWRAVDNEGEVLDFLVQSKRTGLLTVCYRWTMSSSRRSFIQTTMAASGSAR